MLSHCVVVLGVAVSAHPRRVDHRVQLSDSLHPQIDSPTGRNLRRNESKTMLVKSGGSHNDSFFASKGFTHTIAGERARLSCMHVHGANEKFLCMDFSNLL